MSTAEFQKFGILLLILDDPSEPQFKGEGGHLKVVTSLPLEKIKTML